MPFSTHFSILYLHKRSFILKQKLARDTINFEDRHGKLGTKKAQVICYQKNHNLLCKCYSTRQVRKLNCKRLARLTRSICSVYFPN